MALLETRRLTAFYGDFQALFGIDFKLEAGEIVAIIGANGAGKSTFFKTVAGLLPAPAEAVLFDGEAIGGRSTVDIVRRGIALVPEGRRLFASLDVIDNLRIGRDGAAHSGAWTVEAVLDLFPALARRRNAAVTTLSGGEQQMVAIGRALMANPRVLMCDEISLGLAPIVIGNIYASLPRIRAQGASLVIVEQDIRRALASADRIYCFQEGKLSLTGRPSMLTPEQIHAAYFGT
jgi:branched-chain amino acid transport system ATP-binding protein